MVNVTREYDRIFEYNMYIFFVFDIFLAIGVVKKYFFRPIRDYHKSHIIYQLYRLLFAIFVICGSVNLS